MRLSFIFEDFFRDRLPRRLGAVVKKRDLSF